MHQKKRRCRLAVQQNLVIYRKHACRANAHRSVPPLTVDTLQHG
ncbi:hypothetical protein L541_1582 [Bordetella hinzii CA90 BAL1384]|uniref:Uncharacterized protein n=1 Tax=Bordetella hinzii OH87 BAL007II TaxID=1331262 RepID=A0ABR4QUY9_9BORD|nr:hypothetical protein L544_1229 [Bordetella hinzii OH87 BAL007II]KCB27405.1 hypothetical protein L541_1582 [Bordetella hinzii CA90 BAL1384]KCB29106.1 hypothetical protein L543_1037 [Bordetella hinzii L60]KCB43818.1 hypothetical protein L539_1481 [Bordetella hinzii 5132]KCB49860.1 hypothetical protein L538_1256 [Bordetella hinzii 4161]KCB50238.1 hypothetical protein L537_1497 [Bordetella hinzii 1277]